MTEPGASLDKDFREKVDTHLGRNQNPRNPVAKETLLEYLSPEHLGAQDPFSNIAGFSALGHNFNGRLFDTETRDAVASALLNEDYGLISMAKINPEGITALMNRRKTFYNDRITTVLTEASFREEHQLQYQDLVTTLIRHWDEIKDQLPTDDVWNERETYLRMITNILQIGLLHFENEEYIDYYFRKAEEIALLDTSDESRLSPLDPAGVVVAPGIGRESNVFFGELVQYFTPESAKYFSNKWFEAVDKLPQSDRDNIVKYILDFPFRGIVPYEPGGQLKLLEIFQNSLNSGNIDVASIYATLRNDGSVDTQRISSANMLLRLIADVGFERPVIRSDGTYDSEALESLINKAKNKFEINKGVLDSISSGMDAPSEVIQAVVDTQLEEKPELKEEAEKVRIHYQDWLNGISVSGEGKSPIKYYKRKGHWGEPGLFKAIFRETGGNYFAAYELIKRALGDSDVSPYFQIGDFVDLCHWDEQNFGLTDTDIENMIAYASEQDTFSILQTFIVEGINKYDRRSLVFNSLLDEELSNLVANDKKRDVVLGLNKLKGYLEDFVNTPFGTKLRPLIDNANLQLIAFANLLENDNPDVEGYKEYVKNQRKPLDKLINILFGASTIGVLRKSFGVELEDTPGMYSVEGGRSKSDEKRKVCADNFQIVDSVDIGFAVGDKVVIGGPTGAGKTTALKVLWQLLVTGNRDIPNAHKVGYPFSDVINATDGTEIIGTEVPDPNKSLASQSIKELELVSKIKLLFGDELVSGGTDLTVAVIQLMMLEKRSRQGATTIVTTHHAEEMAVVEALLGLEAGDRNRYLNILPIYHTVQADMSNSAGPETFRRIGTPGSAELADIISDVSQQIMYATGEIDVPLPETTPERSASVFQEADIDELDLVTVYKNMLQSRGLDPIIADNLITFLKGRSQEGSEYFENNVHTLIEEYLTLDNRTLEDYLRGINTCNAIGESARIALDDIGNLDYFRKFQLYNYAREIANGTQRMHPFFKASPEEQQILAELQELKLNPQTLTKPFDEFSDEDIINLAKSLENESLGLENAWEEFKTARDIGRGGKVLTESNKNEVLNELDRLLYFVYIKAQNGERSSYLEPLENRFGVFLNQNIGNLRDFLGEERLNRMLVNLSKTDHINARALAALYALEIKNGTKGIKVFNKATYGDSGNVPLRYSEAYNLQLLYSLDHEYRPVSTPTFKGEEVVAQVKIGNQNAGKSATLITEAGLVAHTIISGYCPAESAIFREKPKAIATRIIRSIGGKDYSQYETEAKKLTNIYERMLADPNVWVFIDEISNGVDKTTKQAVIAVFLATALRNGNPFYMTTLSDEPDTLKGVAGSEKIGITGYSRKTGNYQGVEGAVEADTLEMAFELGLFDADDLDLARELYSLLKKYYRPATFE